MSASGQGHYIDPVIEVYKRDVDRGLLVQALRLTPEERLIELQRLVEFGELLCRAGREAKHHT